MVQPVDDLIVQFADAGASMITFHPEATIHVDRTISLIKESGCQAGRCSTRPHRSMFSTGPRATGHDFVDVG